MVIVPIVVAGMFSAIPTRGQIPVRRASPAVSGPINVQNTVIKAGAIPGVFYGTNPGFRYFFEIKNGGAKSFSGKVEITLLVLNQPAGPPDKTFELNIQPGKTEYVSIDSQSAPAIGSSGVITGFRFVALSVAAEGSGSMATNYDRLYPGE